MDQRLSEERVESLSLEFKSWLNLSERSGQAKIVKGCLALYNHGGGSMVIGKTDAGEPDHGNEPTEGNAQNYSHDSLQSLVQQYSAWPFEIKTGWVQSGSNKYFIITVPSGCEFPNAVKKTMGTVDGKGVHLREGEVYVRSISSGNGPSSCLVQPSDWQRLVRVYFRNMRDALHPILEVEGQQSRLDAFLLPSRARKNAVVGHDRPDSHSGFELCAVVEPALVGHAADKSFLNRIELLNPQLRGWPSFAVDRESMKVLNEGWECDCSYNGGTMFPRHFHRWWRIEPAGNFYYSSALDDDEMHEMIAGQTVEGVGALLEAVGTAATVLEIVRGLSDRDPGTVRLAFSMRWFGLKERMLSHWMHPEMAGYGLGKCEQSDVSWAGRLSLDASVDELAAFMVEPIQKLYRCFSGSVASPDMIRAHAGRLLNRSQ